MISSASPTELQRFATTEAARAAELDHQAQRLGAAPGHFAATCTEFSTSIDSSLAHPLDDHARSASAIGERTAAVGRQFERADQEAGFCTTLRTPVQVFHALALRMATGSGGNVSSGNLNPLLQPFRYVHARTIRGRTTPQRKQMFPGERRPPRPSHCEGASETWLPRWSYRRTASRTMCASVARRREPAFPGGHTGSMLHSQTIKYIFIISPRHYSSSISFAVLLSTSTRSSCAWRPSYGSPGQDEVAMRALRPLERVDL